jgi:predicted nucleotidyltransferase
MATTAKESILAYMSVLDGHLVATGHSTALYLSGGAAVVLAYGGTDRTKDVDAFVAEPNEILDELQLWAGKNTPVAKREGFFFEVVPPIYPAAPGMFERAVPIEGLKLQAIKPFAIELHDIIITKLGRYHAKDRADIKLLTVVPTFQADRLSVLYALARDDMRLYWPDKIETTDKNFNLVRTTLIALPPEDWGEGDQ